MIYPAGMRGHPAEHSRYSSLRSAPRRRAQFTDAGEKIHTGAGVKSAPASGGYKETGSAAEIEDIRGITGWRSLDLQLNDLRLRLAQS